MNSRSFLAALGLAPAAAKLAPEIVSREIKPVEVVEYYVHDQLVRRTIGGFDVPFHHQRQPFLHFNPLTSANPQ